MESTETRQTSVVLADIILSMDALEPAERDRVLTTLMAYYRGGRNDAPSAHISTMSESPSPRVLPFGHAEVDPKAFLKEKGPKTDVERVACLAFYLAHHRDLPYFKTQDLTKLNTEAAQPKFSNASYAAANAVKLGYLAAGPKGQRQISAFGEEFVTALPDRDAAKEVASSMRPKRRPKRRTPNVRNQDSPQEPNRAVRPDEK